MTEEGKKVVVIGGGPGGYVSAIRLAQLGARVTLIEKGDIGGTCLNIGCIPTKVLLHTADIYQEILNGKDLGLKVEGDISVDWQQLQKRKDRIVSRLTRGVSGLLKASQVEVINGLASFIDKKTLKVEKGDGQEIEVSGDYFIVATGSEPSIPPIAGVEFEGVIDSTDALSLEELPKELIIIGGGIIGIEFASLFNDLGVKVKVVEMLSYILPPVDREVSQAVKKNMIGQGISIETDSKVLSIKQEGDQLQVELEVEGKIQVISGDKVLLSVGRRSVSNNLNLEAVNVRLNRGSIEVDEALKTNIPNIYAIGDVTGKNMLAHVAIDQGIVAAENIMGLNKKMKYNAIPACVFTKPEIASVGLTEEEAKEKGLDFEVGKFPLIANGKALISKEIKNTFIKIISDKKYDEIIGVHIYGPRATELITEGTLALTLEATIDEIASAIHAHPTIGEAMKEAAMAVKKRAIHSLN